MLCVAIKTSHRTSISVSRVFVVFESLGTLFFAKKLNAALASAEDMHTKSLNQTESVVSLYVHSISD